VVEASAVRFWLKGADIAVVDGLRTVLVVEDDVDTRDALSEYLQCEGFDVAVARDGTEAIHMLASLASPRAMLIDLTMPGISGEQLVEYLGAKARLASIPIAIVSASPERAPPGFRVFAKPIDIDALVEFVRNKAAA
jgi:CheY-like chemotaxis protein